MVRVFFYISNVQKDEYNIRLIKHLCRINGVELIDNPRDADCVWVSCCDTIDVGILKQAQKFKKPIVVGGSVYFLPVMRLWADYVCNGEAYDFIKKFAKIGRIEELKEFDEVSTRDKVGKLNEHIDWKLNPVIQVTKKSYYYYCGKGCPQLCQFCALAWSRGWQKAPQILVERALSGIPDKAKLMPMLSYWDYQVPSYLRGKLGILDVKIKEYLLRGGYQSGHYIRAGIEFASEKLRKKLAKPLSQEAINAFVRLTKYNNHEVALYFIGGLEPEEQLLEFFGQFPFDSDLYPRLNLIFTYFEPQPVTPMADFNLAARYELDRDRLFIELNKMNRRFRTHKIKFIAHSTWRAIMNKVRTREEADYYWGLRKLRDNKKLLEIIAYRNPEYLGSETLGGLLSKPRITKKVRINETNAKAGNVLP